MFLSKPPRHGALRHDDTEKRRATQCSGWTPETVAEVRQKIQDSLDNREVRAISVCVADVSIARERVRARMTTGSRAVDEK